MLVGGGMFCTCEYRECICIPHRIMHCPCGRLLNNTAECNSNVAWGVGGTSTLCMISEEYDGLIRKKTQPLSQLRNNGNSSFAGPYSYILRFIVYIRVHSWCCILYGFNMYVNYPLL